MQEKAFAYATKLYEIAYQLNSEPGLDGPPCVAAFEAARAVLVTTFGRVKGRWIDDRVLSTSEIWLASFADDYDHELAAKVTAELEAERGDA